MRKFKFRAWDPAIQSMLDFQADALREKIWMFIMLNNSKSYGEVLMQWTGFYDSDGKEIFEGDVLRNFRDEESWEVQWNKGHGCWYLHLLPGTKVSTALPLWEIEGDEAYVIGNIYENQELLK